MDGSRDTKGSSSDDKMAALKLEMNSLKVEMRCKRATSDAGHSSALASLECGVVAPWQGTWKGAVYKGFPKVKKTWGSHQQMSIMWKKERMVGYFSLFFCQNHCRNSFLKPSSG